MRYSGINVIKRIKSNIAKNICIIICLTIALVCSICNQFMIKLVDNISSIEFLNTSNNIVTVDCSNSNLKSKNCSFLDNYIKNIKYSVFTNEEEAIHLEENITIDLIGINPFEEKITMPSFDGYGATENTKLIKGNMFSKEDVAFKKNYLLTYETIGRMIFGSDSNIIGERILLNDISYEIIGILKDTPDVIRIAKNYKTNFALNIPLVTYVKEDSNVSRILVYFSNGGLNESGIESISNIFESNGYTVHVTNKKIELEKIYNNTDYQTFEIIKVAFIFIIIVVSIIAVIFLFLVLKDRKFEFSLRKSFGASTRDIIFMFLREILVLFFLAVIFSLFVSIILIATTNAWFFNNFKIVIYKISFDIFIDSIIICFITMIIASIILCFMFSNDKIINGLKGLE